MKPVTLNLSSQQSAYMHRNLTWSKILCVFIGSLTQRGLGKES